MARHHRKRPMTNREYRSGSRRAGWARCVLLAVVLLARPAALAQPAVAEPSLKAAIVFTLAKFAEWPAGQQPAESVSLCVLAAGEPLNNAFSALESKLVQGRPLRVRLLGTRADLSGCHIVFTPAQPPGPVAGRLTVGDGPKFAEAGGMVGLVTANERIQLEINLVAAGAAGMKFSSQLLRLARLVGEAPAKGGG
jgi:hypothetical protein